MPTSATPGAPEAPTAPVRPPVELVGADHVRGGDLDRAASFVMDLLDEPASSIRVAEAQLGLDEALEVPGRPEAFELIPLTPAADAGTVWAVDGGSCTVADGRSFQVGAYRVARVRFSGGATDLIEAAPLTIRAVSPEEMVGLASAVLTELCGEMPDRLPELPRPVDALREWAEWGAVLSTIREAAPGDLVLVDGSLHGGPLVPSKVVRTAHAEATARGVDLAGVVKASTLYWGRHVPLVGLLKRRADRELGPAAWVARISIDPAFGRLYVGDIFVAHLAASAPYAFRVDVARGPASAGDVLSRLAALAGDPAFPGYPYPLARAHAAARVTGYAVADVRRAFRSALGRHGLGEDDIEGLFEDYHVVLNRS
jgi:NurA domain-containing protein